MQEQHTHTQTVGVHSFLLTHMPATVRCSWWPAWRRLPGSNIIVDCFGRSCGSVGNNRTWYA